MSRLLLAITLSTLATHGAESHWTRLRTPNFEMYSGAGQRAARDTIREFEQVRAFFLQLFTGPPAKPAPVRLVAFGSMKEYEPYRLNEFAIAYYHQTPQRDTIVMSHAGSDTFPIAVHEYVHLLVRHAGLDLPPWLNEGLAELYSTLRPINDKVIIGDLIPNRRRALLEGGWVPLATILGADHNSPYYNEKNKAGSLYNEGWALTHMLCLRAEYRPKFNQLIRAIAGGTDSIQALTTVYGRTLPQIEVDLQSYMRGTFFQGVLVPAKLDKASDEVPVESLSDYDTGLMFADLLYRPGKEADAKSALERLAKTYPDRAEPYQGLGYMAWRTGRVDDAVALFGKAFEHGSHDPTMLWDYGRLVARKHGAEAIRVLSELLALDGNRTEVRLEVAEAQLRANQPKESLATVAPIRTVTPKEAPRLFRIAVYANLNLGDQANAEAAAKHYQDVAKTDEDRATARELLSLTAARARPTFAAPPVESRAEDESRPQMRRRAAGPGEIASTATPSRPSASGEFVELDCRESQPRMIIETAEGRRAFIIEDPTKVAITAGSEGPIDMTCGPQKQRVKVTLEFAVAPPSLAGVTGIVRTLAF